MVDKNRLKYTNKSVEEKLVEFKMLAIVLCAAIIVTGFMGGCVVINWLGKRED